MEWRQLYKMYKKILHHGTGFPINSFIESDTKMIECPECGGRACHSKYKYNHKLKK